MPSAPSGSSGSSGKLTRPPSRKKDIDTLPDGAAEDDIDASASDEVLFDDDDDAAAREQRELDRVYDVFQLPIRRAFDEEPTRKAHAPKAPRHAFTAEENTDIVDMNESWDNFRHIDDEPSEQRRDTDH